MGPLALAIVVGFVLAVQWRLADGLGDVCMVIYRFQAAFWFVAFVVVPFVLVLVQPRTKNPLYDQRLAFTSYNGLLSAVLAAVIVGQCGFVFGQVVVCRLSARSPRRIVVPMSRSTTAAMSVLLVIGWLGRSGSLAGFDGLGRALAPFGTAAACMLIAQYKGRSALLIASLVFAGECAWSALDSTKTPVIAAVVALMIRSVWTLGRRRAARLVPIAGLLMIASFLIIQPLKGIDTAQRSSEYVGGSRDSAVIGSVAGVLERFDGTMTVTDAVAFPDRPWLPPAEYLEQLVGGVVPRGVLSRGSDDSVGVVWTKEVRTRTSSDQFQSVAIAAGPIAEGYVEAGYVGAFVASFIFSVVTFLACRGITARILPVRLFSAMLVFSAVLYEEALIAVSNSFVKALEFAIIGMIAAAMTGGLSTVAADPSSPENAGTGPSPIQERVGAPE